MFCEQLGFLGKFAARASRTFLDPYRTNRLTSLFTTSAEEDQLYRHTTASGRWLYNENIQMERRYVRFNANALAEIAASTVGAHNCVSFQKLAEGTSNKIYLSAFDNGAEVIARIPTPITGPRHLVTASEVATMDFVRNILQIPVPKVLSWSSRAAETNVGAEFIIMEKSAGTELSLIWPPMAYQPRRVVSKQLAEIERKFASLEFSHYGSIFFKNDLEGYPHTKGLFSNGNHAELEGSCSKYAIGPLMHWDFWHGERSQMNADRGPWDNPISYMRGLVRCEQQWLAKYPKPRDLNDPFIRSVDDNNPAVHIKLLDDFLSVVPHMLPGWPLTRPTLWHTDLHLSNICVSPEEPHDILSILDWQGVCLAPLYVQATLPKAMAYTGTLIDKTSTPLDQPPPLPANFESLTREEQREVKRQRIEAVLETGHMVLIKKNPLQLAAMSHPHLNTILEPVYAASQTWQYGFAHLRFRLVRIQEQWDKLVDSKIPCPLHFSREEIEEIVAEYERHLTYDNSVNELMQTLGVQSDGWVPRDEFEVIKRKSDQMKLMWDVEAACGPYPFQDGGISAGI